jgi:aspartyl-tRNA(Asn)/glutamyl-tRNA(Gln) amidotransferase subunit B
MRSSAEAVEYAQALHALVVWLGICDGNMQEGSFRCDANVSVRRPGHRRHAREIKNLNSFRFMQQAIDYEVQWQIDLSRTAGEVRRRRCCSTPSRRDAGHAQQEDAHVLPLLPDPDLPPLAISHGVDRRRPRRACRSCRATWRVASAE